MTEVIAAVNRLTKTLAAVGVVLLYKDATNAFTAEELNTITNAEYHLKREVNRG